jgi:hypothetical protein
MRGEIKGVLILSLFFAFIAHRTPFMLLEIAD